MSYQNPYGNNPYANENDYELNDAPYTSTQQDDQEFVEFMTEINQIHTELDTYQNLVNNIDSYQKRLLTEINYEAEQTLRAQLDTLTNNAQQVQNELRDQIKSLQAKAAKSQSNTMKAQIENSRQNFLKIIQDYRIVEANHKDSTKQQAIRQYKIIQPDATDEELEDAILDSQGQQIFSQALLNANRRGEAKTVLQEVQERHRDLLVLEKSMAELTQLFNDMEQLIVEQQENIEHIEQNVDEAQHDVEMGLGHTNKAVTSARRARKNKIRCYIILALILAVVVVVIVVPIVKR
ncbi:hypothetical protein QEN19_000328 [Hanseniaspora menglaensis]